MLDNKDTIRADAGVIFPAIDRAFQLIANIPAWPLNAPFCALTGEVQSAAISSRSTADLARQAVGVGEHGVTAMPLTFLPERVYGMARLLKIGWRREGAGEAASSQRAVRVAA